MTPRRLAHKLWIKRQRERYHGIYTGDNNPICENCFCEGNNECGNMDGYDEDCALDSLLICPCCQRDSEPITDAEEDKLTGQERLI